MAIFCVILGGLAAVLGRALWSDLGLPPAMASHAALMLVAWGVMIPMGGIVARYFKVTPRQNFPEEVDSRFWWDWHRGLQYGGMALSSVGLLLILWETGGRFATLHGRCGIVVMTIGWLQVASALLRGSKGGATDKRADPSAPLTWRGDHYDMSRRRLAFEIWHKTAGWAVIVLAGVTILLGIDLIGAPDWLLVLVAIFQAAVLLALVDGRLRRRWVDTYEALWGPDPVHPGNRRVTARSSRRHRPRSPR